MSTEVTVRSIQTSTGLARLAPALGELVEGPQPADQFPGGLLLGEERTGARPGDRRDAVRAAAGEQALL
jgi:hypothetical protein